MWGFLCPIFLDIQLQRYSFRLSRSSRQSPVTESLFEQYPPWSCCALGCFDLGECALGLCCCCYGFQMGCERHRKDFDRERFEHYCSSQECCCLCCRGYSIEDLLIGHFCCCCSVIQVAMAVNERFRMQFEVEGDLNIKRAHWKRKKEVLTREKRVSKNISLMKESWKNIFRFQNQAWWSFLIHNKNSELSMFSWDVEWGRKMLVITNFKRPSSASLSLSSSPLFLFPFFLLFLVPFLRGEQTSSSLRSFRWFNSNPRFNLNFHSHFPSICIRKNSRIQCFLPGQ